jgi:peptidyl-prolyl cis-trans isomerase B (cyclophilin B)
MKKIYTITIFLLALTLSKAQTVYTGKPMYKMDIKRAGIYLGTIKIELFPNIAPHSVRNFDSLVGVSFYDSTAFHRVIPGFMIQGGDPNSRHGPTSTWGYGQPGQPTVNAEFSVAKHVRGILSAARSNNINSATSQFFICVAAAPSLNGQYSIYGRVTSGMNIVDTIVMAPRNANDLPNLKHEMFVTAIGSNDTVPNAPSLYSPANGIMAVDSTVSLLLKWNAVSDAIIYSLEVSDDPLFQNIVKSADSPNLAFYLTPLHANTKYYWHVKTNNGGHFSSWSATWTFDTNTDAVGLANYTAANHDVLVFPNPGPGKFTFSHLTKGDKLQVFDMMGKLLYVAVTDDSSLLINMEDKDRGVYTYKISSNNKAPLQGKLVLE